jgi:hypothetical protein
VNKHKKLQQKLKRIGTVASPLARYKLLMSNKQLVGGLGKTIEHTVSYCKIQTKIPRSGMRKQYLKNTLQPLRNTRLQVKTQQR